jgi:hypothetical protein
MASQARLALALLGGLAAAGCDSYRYETYVAELDGALEGVATTARGRAVLLLGRRGDRAEITLSVSGVRSAIIGSYVRLAPRGQTGPPVYTLWLPGQGAFDDGNPILRVWEDAASAGAVAFDDSMLRALRDGNLYVNVQTQQRPSGEVRGQLLLE